MDTLRRLLKDRSATRVRVPTQPADAIGTQRDSIQNILNGRKLETLGKLSLGYRTAVLPCLESIQTDLQSVFQLHGGVTKIIRDTNLLLETALQVPELKWTSADAAYASTHFAAHINAGAYLYFCGSRDHASLAKQGSSILHKVLTCLDTLELFQSLIGDICSTNWDRVIRTVDYELTRFAIEPIYGRHSDSQQIRALKGLLQSLQYYDPVDIPSDFWPVYDRDVSVELIDRSCKELLPTLLKELSCTIFKIKAWPTHLKESTYSHVAEQLVVYVSACIDRTYALTLLTQAFRLLFEDLYDFTQLRFNQVAADFLRKCDSTDYGLITSELKALELRLLA